MKYPVSLSAGTPTFPAVEKALFHLGLGATIAVIIRKWAGYSDMAFGKSLVSK